MNWDTTAVSNKVQSSLTAFISVTVIPFKLAAVKFVAAKWDRAFFISSN